MSIFKNQAKRCGKKKKKTLKFANIWSIELFVKTFLPVGLALRSKLFRIKCPLQYILSLNALVGSRFE